MVRKFWIWVEDRRVRSVQMLIHGGGGLVTCVCAIKAFGSTGNFVLSFMLGLGCVLGFAICLCILGQSLDEA